VINRILTWVVRIGMDPNDDDDIRLQKSLLTLCAIPFAFAGVIWGLTYILLGEPLAGAIPLSYAVISLLSIILFGLTHRYHFFRFSQLTLILLLPFLLMMALGGFVNGSSVILWAQTELPNGHKLRPGSGRRNRPQEIYLRFMGRCGKHSQPPGNPWAGGNDPDCPCHL